MWLSYCEIGSSVMGAIRVAIFNFTFRNEEKKRPAERRLPRARFAHSVSARKQRTDSRRRVTRNTGVK